MPNICRMCRLCSWWSYGAAVMDAMPWPPHLLGLTSRVMSARCISSPGYAGHGSVTQEPRSTHNRSHLLIHGHLGHWRSCLIAIITFLHSHRTPKLQGHNQPQAADHPKPSEVCTAAHDTC